jgi:ribosomal-protein-alanine N-acetyltransferase
MDGTSPTAPVVIRDATAADVEKLSALRPPRGLHQDRVGGGEGERRYVLAEVGGKPVGFGVVYFRGDPMWERPEQVPLVMDLWVAPEVRGRGVGSRIIAALENAARERGFPCIYLQVQAERNPRAISLYRKLGYQPLGRRAHTDLFHTVDEQGNVHEGEEIVLDMQKWL